MSGRYWCMRKPTSSQFATEAGNRTCDRRKTTSRHWGLRHWDMLDHGLWLPAKVVLAGLVVSLLIVAGMFLAGSVAATVFIAVLVIPVRFWPA